ncbi:MAG: ABC transporter permease [Acidimicrobiia bacterium]|nr:ABC transporter permease [Acidimicrobiia bacterium]
MATELAASTATAPKERRFVIRRRDIGGLIAAILTATAIIASFTADLWLPVDPNLQDLLGRLAPPFFLEGGSTVHVLGTDELGRDLFARTVVGGQVSFIVGLTVATVAGVIGIALGVLAGYRRGFMETLIMRFVDVQTAFPFLVIAIAIVSIVGASLRTIIVTLIIYQWVPFARLAHAKTLTVKQLDYYRAAVAIGRKDLGIALRHVVPNILPPLLVIWTFIVARSILAEAAMSFLGLGVPPPTPTWGGMLSGGRGYLDSAWWIPIIPGVAVTLVVIGVNVVGDWLSKRWDPRASY